MCVRQEYAQIQEYAQSIAHEKSRGASAVPLIQTHAHVSKIRDCQTGGLVQTRGSSVYYIDITAFTFEATGFDSDVLQSAFDRYTALLFAKYDQEDSSTQPSASYGNKTLSKHNRFIKTLMVHVASNDQSLNLETDESYVLDITAPHGFLSANTVYGALHGLETFSQLLDEVTNKAGGGLENEDGTSEDSENKHKKKKRKKHHKKHKKHHKEEAAYSVNQTYIWDAPRFRHRGLLIDSARHFLPVPVILDHLDAMAWSKLNVLHWHIVDDQSFPYVSRKLPLLSGRGAFSPDLVYTPEDVQQIIGYAKERGIRVVPELDTPGHTLSWGEGYPDLLADCYDEKGHELHTKGPMNPAQNETYELLWALLQEVAAAFPDSYIHVGGDEVAFNCWLNNPEIKDWMAQQDPEIRSMPALEQYFEQRVLNLVAAAGRSYIVWQEVQDDTVIQVWKWWWPTSGSDPALGNGLRDVHESAGWTSALSRKGLWPLGVTQSLREKIEAWLWPDQQSNAPEKPKLGAWNCTLSFGCEREGDDAENDVPGWAHEIERVTAQGYRTLLSSPWYLNLGGFASNDWARYYAVEPLDFSGTKKQKDLVIGGEACIWGEFVDATNSIQRTWPRAAAVAERLWSHASVRDEEDALQRLTDFRCNLVARGVDAEPVGPGFCTGEEP